jgi:sensor c-di-GMP phosphodiesterase-like protein
MSIFHPNKDKLIRARQSLNFIWLAVSIIIMGLLLNAQLKIYKLRQEKQLEQAISLIADNLDKQINSIERAVNLIEVNNASHHCSNQLIRTLQTLLFNYPHLSGIAITNLNHQLLCSTLPLTKSEIKLLSNDTYFSNPILFSHDPNQVHVLSLQRENVVFQLMLLQSTLNEIINITPLSKIHFSLKRNIDNKVVYENNIKLENNHLLVARENLQNIPDTYIELETVQILNNTQVFMILSLLIFVSILSYGLNRITINQISKKYSIESFLEYAYQNQLFFPVYLPTYDIANQSINGAEVLMRLKTAEGDIIQPDSFIPALEQTPLITDVTLFLVDSALREHQRLLKNTEYHLAINICANMLKDNRFYESLSNLMQTYQVAPQQLILEITERAIFDFDDSNVKTNIHQLHQLGVKLAIDDFGTGHASIQYLQYYPFSYLKIDKLFVQSIGTGAITESLNEAIITLAKRLNLEIIAEGVETEEQFQYLQQHQVPFCQGWYFSKPLIYTEFEKYMLKTNTLTESNNERTN